MNGTEQLQSIKERIINSLLLFMSFCSLPLLATSLLNFLSSGWKASMLIDIGGLLSIPVIYILRNKLSYYFRTGFLITLSYISGIWILMDYGFLGGGILILSSLTLFSSLFYGMRFGWIAMALSLAGIACVGILYEFNYLIYRFDFNTYIHSPLTWIDQAVTFLFFVGVVVVATGSIYKALVKRIDQVQVEEEKFRGLFNNIQDAISIHAMNGKILEVNDSFLLLYHVSKEEVYSYSISELSAPEYSPATIDAYLDRARKGEKFSFEWKGKRISDGGTFDVEVMLSLIQFGDQNAILANIRDITQRKKTEDDLRKSEEKYRNLIEFSPSSIFIVQDERFVYANPAGVEALGYNLIDEVIGKDLFSIASPDYKRRGIERLTNVLGGKKNTSMEMEVLRPDRKEYWAETVSLPFEYNNSPAALIIGFNITERKQAEKELVRNREYLRAILIR